MKGGWQRPMLAVFMLAATLLLLHLPSAIEAMRVDPERIWARLRLEADAEAEAAAAEIAGGGEQQPRPAAVAVAASSGGGGRSRRQLIGGTPKEETIQVTAPLFSSRLFEFGPRAGDKEIGSGLDTAKRLPLSRPLAFFGQQHSAVWVLSNGGIGFEQSARQYRANILPSGVKVIAPFWNRNDLRNGGKIYYREIAGGRVLERGQSEIRYQYDLEVKVHSAVLATFEKMQPVATDPLPEENTNTFQLALFVTSNGTFANFIYSNIGWTQGAEAGFNAGDGQNFFALPTSGTGNIMYLEDYGNTGIPGEWMFILGADRVQRCKAGIKGDTCDEACAAGEWGADCLRCCHCAEGGCNETSGQCKMGGCAQCWTGPACQQKEARCAVQPKCGQNAAQTTENNRCGEPQQRCQCLSGYVGDPNTECADIDECAKPGTCHPKAQCTNTPGRFFCQCPEGFQGDGISECVAAFLYPFEQSHRLPNDRHGRVEWQLKHALRIFGRDRDSLWLTSNGLILVKGAKNVPAKSGERHKLDGMDVQGVAPFFAPIDLAQQGQIFVEETTDPRILGKAERLVSDQLGGQAEFTASHALLVTYVNVSLGGVGRSAAAASRPVNTFQTLLLGGRDAKRQPATFVQFLYRDIQWGEDAEAGIMAPDKANSILLPGSGTEGIEQLSQLSNVRSQGVWLYRIDGVAPSACIQSDLQPPYCDARSPAQAPSPNRLPVPAPAPNTSAPPQSPAPKRRPSSTTAATTTASPPPPPTTPPPPPATSTDTAIRQSFGLEGEEDGEGEQQQQVVEVRPQFPQVEQSGWVPIGQKGKPEAGIGRKDPKKPAIVQIQSREFEEMPPDAFDDGSVSRTTTTQSPVEVPSVEEAANSSDGDDELREIVPSLIVPELVKPAGNQQPPNDRIVPSFVQQPAEVEQRTEPKTQQPNGQQGRANVIETSVEAIPAAPSRPRPQQPQLRIEQATARNIAISSSTTTMPSTTERIEERTMAETVPEPMQTIGPEESPEEEEETLPFSTPALPPPQTPAPSSPTADREELSSQAPEVPTTMGGVSSRGSEPASNGSNRFFVFNTTKPKPLTTTKKVPPTKPATTEPPKQKPANPDGDDPILMDWDREENPLDGGIPPGSKLSIVVPIAIVLVWLVVLVVVAVFLCCRRRQTQERLRTLYGPAYQIRPVYTMRVNKPNGFGGLMEGSYEEHLEKAAQRLSAELAYNPNPHMTGPGRYSLYGSYWNISPEGSAAGRHNQQPNKGHPRPATSHPSAMDISSPRSQESGGQQAGGGGGSVFTNYVQQLANGHRSGGGAGEGATPQGEFFSGGGGQQQQQRAGQPANNGGGAQLPRFGAGRR